MANFVDSGNTIDYIPSADVAAGDVVIQGTLVGVAKVPIASGLLGALAVDGVFDFAKVTGSSTAIAVGTKVYWNATTKIATATATSNTLIGKTVQAAADADPLVRVRMNQ